MVTKSEINNRFIIAVEALLKSNQNLTKGRISKALKISPSKFSEILGKRMNVGSDTLGLLCQNFNVNPYWLLTGGSNMATHSKRTLAACELPHRPSQHLTDEPLNKRQQEHLHKPGHREAGEAHGLTETQRLERLKNGIKRFYDTIVHHNCHNQKTVS